MKIEKSENKRTFGLSYFMINRWTGLLGLAYGLYIFFVSTSSKFKIISMIFIIGSILFILVDILNLYDELGKIKAE